MRRLGGPFLWDALAIAGFGTIAAGATTLAYAGHGGEQLLFLALILTPVSLVVITLFFARAES